MHTVVRSAAAKPKVPGPEAAPEGSSSTTLERGAARREASHERYNGISLPGLAAVRSGGWGRRGMLRATSMRMPDPSFNADQIRIAARARRCVVRRASMLRSNSAIPFGLLLFAPARIVGVSLVQKLQDPTRARCESLRSGRLLCSELPVLAAKCPIVAAPRHAAAIMNVR